MRIFVAHQNLPISKNYISSGHLIIWRLVISGCDQIVCSCWIPIYVCPRFFWFFFNNLVIIRFVWFTGEFDRCFEAVLSDIKSVDKTFFFINCVSVSALLCTSELIMCQPLVVVFLFLSTISSKYSFTESQINAVSLHVGSWSFQQWIVEIVYSTAEQRRRCSAHLILDSVQVNLYHQHTRRFTMTCRLHPVTVTILWWCSWLQARLATEHILLAAAYGRPVTETGPRAYTSCSCLWSTSHWDWPQSVCFLQLLMVDQSLRLAPERILPAAAYGRPVTETGPRAYALCSCLWLTSHWDALCSCLWSTSHWDALCSCLWSTSHWDWPQSVCFVQLLMVDQSLRCFVQLLMVDQSLRCFVQLLMVNQSLRLAP